VLAHGINLHRFCAGGFINGSSHAKVTVMVHNSASLLEYPVGAVELNDCVQAVALVQTINTVIRNADTWF